MSYTTKRRIMNSTVYIVLALVITAVLCVTVVSIAGMRQKKTEAPESSDRAAGIFSPSEPAPTPAKNDPPSENRADPPSEDDGRAGGKPAIEPVNPVYYLPAAGGVLKEYSPAQPIRSLTMNDYRTHPGVDISVPVGTAVVAMANGTIADVYSDPMMGMCLSIDHGAGLVSTYKNLSYTLPEGIVKGATVKAGQTVAAVGDTSLIELADAEHLHFELTLNGKHVDPAGYLELSKLMVDSGTE